jgi:glycosidase
MLKTRLLIFSVFLAFNALSAQMVTTSPALPVSGAAISIFYDTSKDVGDLHNYTGDLYVHTGVTINGTTWQHVIGTWGNNTSQPRLKYLGNHLYELDIVPDLKTFYSMGASEVATQICLVFRNPAGTMQTRPDIFLDVFASKLNTLIILPAKSSMITDLNQQIPVKAAAIMADSVTLYINNQYVKSGNTPDLVTDTIKMTSYGAYWIKSVAWDKPSFAADSFFVYVKKPVTVEVLPQGMEDGINYTGNSSVTLVLHAPYKNFVFVTGDFTGWVPGDKGYMKRTPDGERYWVSIGGLDPGKEYRFQYYVDSTLYIADPYADKILDPSNDQYISTQTYPDLISYPENLATGIVSVLQTAQVPYQWKTAGFQPPDKSKLTIYELLIRDFTAAHDFRTLTDTLGYLARLGINAIELMPVCEFEGNLSWGYNPDFYFAPDKYYGPKNDMKAFIDSCHARGIAVIMDMVLNHCYGQSPFVQLYLDHYGADQIYMKVPNPWFNASSPNPVYKFGADFNHESPSTRQLVDRINAYWLTEYKIDGFRFDFTKGFTNTPGEGSAYDASRIAILERMAGRIRQVKPDAYLILEHFTANAEEKELSDNGMMIWGNGNSSYSSAAEGVASDLTYNSYLGRGWDVPALVTYMESHDEERLMVNVFNNGASAGSYNTRDLKTALKRMELDAVFFLTIPGPKMIWQFGELGYDIPINEGGRTSEKPIKWDYYAIPGRYHLFLTYKALNHLRATQNAFSTGSFSYSLTQATKRLQLTGSSMNVNILGNFGVTGSSINPAFPNSGKWYEYFTGDSITVADNAGPIDLQPGEFRLYTTKKLESAGLVTGIKDINPWVPETKITVYPNPSAGEFRFNIENETPGKLTVRVYDLSGRMIRDLSEYSPGGSRLITWDGRDSNGSDAAEGIYFVKFSSSVVSSTARIIKIRK